MTRTISADVSLSHRSRIGERVTVLAACGDLYSNGAQWYEVECADGAVIHLMDREMDAPTARLSGRDVTIIGETPSPWDGDTATWLRATRHDNGAEVSAPAEYFVMADEDPQEFDNREMLAQLSDAARAGTPGMETHPHYRPVDDLRGEDLCETCVRENGRPDLAAHSSVKWCSLCGGRVRFSRTLTAYRYVHGTGKLTGTMDSAPCDRPDPMPASIPARLAAAARIAITAACERATPDMFEAVTPGQLVVGDIVPAHGMVLLVTDAPRLSRAHAGGRTFYTSALVCNREAVSHDAVPYGWTSTASNPARGLAAEPEGTHRWTLQGNDHASVLRFAR